MSVFRAWSTADPGGTRADKVAERVARQIVSDVVDQKLEPGSLLMPEAQMVEQYEVSRASLREALRVLEAYGLLTIKPGPGGGPVLREVSSKDVARTLSFYYQLAGTSLKELLQARQFIEPIIARLAASNEHGDDDIRALRGAIDGEAIDESRAGNRQFGDLHSVLIGICGNQIVTLFGDSLRVPFNDRLGSRRVPESEQRVIHMEHNAIATAVLDRDPDAAEQLMKDHIETFTQASLSRIPGLLEDVLDWR
jgi:DNA-binding FadR family transcriptional regulator